MEVASQTIRVIRVMREDPAQHGSVAGPPKNRQRILSVRRSERTDVVLI